MKRMKKKKRKRVVMIRRRKVMLLLPPLRERLLMAGLFLKLEGVYHPRRGDLQQFTLHVTLVIMKD